MNGSTVPETEFIPLTFKCHQNIFFFSPSSLVMQVYTCTHLASFKPRAPTQSSSSCCCQLIKVLILLPTAKSMLILVFFIYLFPTIPNPAVPHPCPVPFFPYTLFHFLEYISISNFAGFVKKLSLPSVSVLRLLPSPSASSLPVISPSSSFTSLCTFLTFLPLCPFSLMRDWSFRTCAGWRTCWS